MFPFVGDGAKASRAGGWRVCLYVKEINGGNGLELKSVGLLRFFEGDSGGELGDFCVGAFILPLEAAQLAFALSDFEPGGDHLVFFPEIKDSADA